MALSDVYSQQPWAPAQGVAKGMQDAFDPKLLEGISQYREDQQPISPWKKAFMRLAMGHDHKQVASDLKREMAGGAGAEMVVASPGMSASYEQPEGPTPQEPDVLAGMTNKDAREAMPYLQMMSKQKGDAMELERLKQQGALNLQQLKGTQGTELQGKKNEGSLAVQAEKTKGAHERIQEKRDESIQHHRDYQDYLQVLRDRIAAYKQISGGRKSKDPNFEALVKKAMSASNAFAKMGSSGILPLTPEGKKNMESAKEDAAAAWGAVEAYKASHPEVDTETNFSESTKTPAAQEGTSKFHQAIKNPEQIPVHPTGRRKTDANGIVWEELSDGTARKVK